MAKGSKKRKAGQLEEGAKRGENAYRSEVLKLLESVEDYDWHSSESMVRCEVLGGPLVEKYAWAVPDNTALGIIKHFSPIIELGAGRGYWASLLRDMLVDIIAVDKYSSMKTHTKVLTGEPKILKKAEHAQRALLLCYPDDRESMSMECLEHFRGETIIHIGELAITGTKAGGLQRPWGKTTCSEFQVGLMEEFHCVLRHRLTNFPTSCDYLTVWKRTPFVGAIPEEDEDDDDQSGGDGGWAVIPKGEELDLGSQAAEEYASLL